MYVVKRNHCPKDLIKVATGVNVYHSTRCIAIRVTDVFERHAYA
jgi:hypothetical protein